MTPIYLDNAASTRVADEVIALMTDVMRTAWGNPSAAHPQGAAARAHIDTARTRMLAALGDNGLGDIIWTSG
jgi:cysteine desulfurase